jgi:hypothetical protein
LIDDGRKHHDRRRAVERQQLLQHEAFFVVQFDLAPAAAAADHLDLGAARDDGDDVKSVAGPVENGGRAARDCRLRGGGDDGQDDDCGR